MGRGDPAVSPTSRACLPEIRSSSEVYGEATDDLAGVPIAASSAISRRRQGQACFQQGEAKNTYGTGCFMLMNTGEISYSSKCGLLTRLSLRAGEGGLRLEGSIAIAGALVHGCGTISA